MTIKLEEYPQALKDAFPGLELTQTTPRRFWLDMGPADLLPAVRTLRERFGMSHLSTICGEDMRDHFLANYFMGGEVVVTFRVRLDHDNPVVPSISCEIPGSMPYEREMHDMFGIEITDLPDRRRSTLPEDWPEGVYPLRKDVKLPRADAPADQA